MIWAIFVDKFFVPIRVLTRVRQKNICLFMQVELDACRDGYNWLRYVPTSCQWWMWGKREAHINWSMVTCKVVAPVTGTTLRPTDPMPADSRQ